MLLAPEVTMHVRSNGTALLGLMLLGFQLSATAAGAQAVDSTHRWSLYGGTVPTEGYGHASVSNLELGGSVDFRTRLFPLPLRANLAFGQLSSEGNDARMKFGTLSLDAVARPLPKILGAKLYLLGGLGVGTRAEYSGFNGGSYFSPDVAPMPYTFFRQPRQTWAFLEGGIGLELGRAFFQLKRQSPVASQGYTRTPVSIGFRF